MAIVSHKTVFRSARPAPHVRILMATRNGARYLPAQLDSILSQTHTNWSLLLRDDGSTDNTLACLTAFRDAHRNRRIHILPSGVPTSCGGGAAANFFRLLSYLDQEDASALTAFADQDDVWLPHKLARAIAMLKEDFLHDAPPTVYASRSIHTDAYLRPQSLSTLHSRPPSFANALVQNVLSGNTIVMNPAATTLISATCTIALRDRPVPFHDWWIYLIASGAGARIILDPEPGLLYRQHGANVLGAHVGINARLVRMKDIVRGHWRDWIDRNLAALNSVSDLLTPEHRATLSSFAVLRRAPTSWGRFAELRRLGIHRQTRAGDALIQALAFAGRL